MGNTVDNQVQEKGKDTLAAKENPRVKENRESNQSATRNSARLNSAKTVNDTESERQQLTEEFQCELDTGDEREFPGECVEQMPTQKKLTDRGANKHGKVTNKNRNFLLYVKTGTGRLRF